MPITLWKCDASNCGASETRMHDTHPQTLEKSRCWGGKSRGRHVIHKSCSTYNSTTQAQTFYFGVSHEPDLGLLFSSNHLIFPLKTIFDSFAKAHFAITKIFSVDLRQKPWQEMAGFATFSLWHGRKANFKIFGQWSPIFHRFLSKVFNHIHSMKI